MVSLCLYILLNFSINKLFCFIEKKWHIILSLTHPWLKHIININSRIQDCSKHAKLGIVNFSQWFLEFETSKQIIKHRIVNFFSQWWCSLQKHKMMDASLTVLFEQYIFAVYLKRIACLKHDLQHSKSYIVCDHHPTKWIILNNIWLYK